MKKITVLFLILWLVQPCFSQQEPQEPQKKKSYFDEYGVMIGPAYSTINGGESWSGTFGFQFGVETQVYKHDENSSFYLGLLASFQGASYEDDYGYDGYDYDDYDYYGLKSTSSEHVTKGKVSLIYIAIPMLYNYKFDEGFYVEGGIQPAFNISAKDKIDGGESYDFKDAINTFELGIPIGGGYWVNDRLCVGLRAVFGVTNINNSEGVERGENYRNFMLLGVARYNIHKNK